MKKLFLLLSFVYATPALALTCTTGSSGNTDCIDPISAQEDCEALGYSKKEVSGCSHYLYCPFNIEYKTCASFKSDLPAQCSVGYCVDSKNTCQQMCDSTQFPYTAEDLLIYDPDFNPHPMDAKKCYGYNQDTVTGACSATKEYRYACEYGLTTLANYSKPMCACAPGKIRWWDDPENPCECRFEDYEECSQLGISCDYDSKTGCYIPIGCQEECDPTDMDFYCEWHEVNIPEFNLTLNCPTNIQYCDISDTGVNVDDLMWSSSGTGFEISETDCIDRNTLKKTQVVSSVSCEDRSKICVHGGIKYDIDDLETGYFCVSQGAKYYSLEQSNRMIECFKNCANRPECKDIPWDPDGDAWDNGDDCRLCYTFYCSYAADATASGSHYCY